MSRLVQSLVILSAIAALLAPGTAHARCISRLPVTGSFPTGYVGAYGKAMKLRVATSGPAVSGLRAEIYTFGGTLIGSGKLARTLTSRATITMKLRYTLQKGKYTLVLKGRPNKRVSCGEKELDKVVSFHGCVEAYPVKIPTLPSGKAADYKGFLSFDLTATGPLLHGVGVSVSDFKGVLFGSATVDPLFNTATVDLRLKRRLAAGKYTLYVSGYMPDQPHSCGLKHVQATLTFT